MVGGFCRAALHAKHRQRIIRMHGVMDAHQFPRAHHCVDQAVEEDADTDDLGPNHLRFNRNNEGADCHYDIAVADVDALFTRQHMQPVLEQVVC